MRALLWLSIALGACGTASLPDEDSGPLEDGSVEDGGPDEDGGPGEDGGRDAGRRDAGPPLFEVAVQTTAGAPIEDGGMLGVHYGCQGGAHTYFSVVATGAGLANAELVLELYGMRATYMMTETATGAELLSILFVLSDFAPAGALNDMSDVLTATVRRSDGASVVVDRSISFVEENRCTSMCTYSMTPGRALITNVDGPASSAGCAPDGVNVTFDFMPDSGPAEPDIVVGVAIPPDCVAALGVVDGGDVAAVREDLLPGGTCNPRFYRLVLDYVLCEPICPAP